MTEVAALEDRVTRLEGQILEGFKRIEDMLRSEIKDLKDEQIKDLREGNKRLADDQRRAWEAIESLRRHEDQRYGAERTKGAIWYFFCAAIGSIVTAIIAWLSKGGTPPHP